MLLRAYRSTGAEAAMPAFADIRREGVSFGELQCALGVYVIAVPIAIGSNPCVAALASAYALKDRNAPPRRDDLVAELRRCADEISAQF
jgi:DNA-binding IclR family transcriptional regulator